MLSSFFLIASSGEVVIEKHWHEVTQRTVCDFFWDQVTSYDSREEVPPILTFGKYYLISIFRNNVFFLATASSETAPLSVIEFLHRVFDTFEEYFGSVEEETVKDNFATAYQLLEEMMDFGIPLTTEPNALKALIKPPSLVSRITSALHIGQEAQRVSDVLPDGTISNMPWRQSGVFHSNNEIYLDLVEEVDSILTVDGLIVSSDVSGVILANSKLSGVPDLTLQFKDPSLIDDCSFHPCVRYNRFDKDKVVSFVPPDGPFELMRYRVNKRERGLHVVAPCYASPTVVYDYENQKGTITVLVGARASASLLYPGDQVGSGGSGSGGGGKISVENVVVTIPFTKAVKTANLKVSGGTVLYDEAAKVAKWTVGTLSNSNTLQLTGTMLLHGSATAARPTAGAQRTATPLSPAGAGTEESPPVQLEWSVPTASLSGMSVASLTLKNETYKPYKGVKTVAKSGRFHIRTM
jgi:AP-3 complex subunit mu